jgi:hypothetical protein
MSASEKTYCSVCAWRKTCQKRFTIKDRICPDYTRDLSLPRKTDEEKEEDHEGTDKENH